MKVAAFHEGRVLVSAELEPVGLTCPMCGADAGVPVTVIQLEPEVRLRRCDRCRAVSSSRLPTAAALEDYYATYYEGDRAAAVTTDDPTRLARRVARYVGPRRPVSVLDLGGGDGSIAVAVLTQLHSPGSVTVVDYDHRRRAATPAGVTLSHVDSLDALDDRRFELVMASAVLEHLPRPAPALRQLLDRVADGGVFYARTPYVVPLITAAQHVGWKIDFTFPAHLYDLGSDFWRRVGTWLPDMRGFDVLASRPSPVETSFGAHPARTLAAAALKAPWWLLRERWPYVGGWEFAARRRGE